MKIGSALLRVMAAGKAFTKTMSFPHKCRVQLGYEVLTEVPGITLAEAFKLRTQPREMLGKAG
jgi:hypothetical protein